MHEKQAVATIFHYKLRICYDTDRTENTASCISIVACVLVVVGTSLASRCLATIGGVHKYTDSKVFSLASSYFLK
jgi:hypothetical protein